MKFILSLIVLLFTVVASAQYSNFNTQRNWSLNKKEVRIGVGGTQFLSDLGGRDMIGTDYRPWDIDWHSSRFNIELGYRYRFHPYWATTTSFHFGRLYASDRYTSEIFRRSRNITVRTTTFELSQRLDYIFYANEKVGKRYNIPGLKGLKDRNTQAYLFLGIGALAYIPKAQYAGAWHKLRPLSTEGQGLNGGPPPYGIFTVSVPMGIGWRMGISRMWRVGFEASYVKTFSDYIDDTHGVYFDSDAILAAKGPVAAALSNPYHDYNLGLANSYDTGQQRGDKENDAYFYLNLVVTRNVTYKAYHRRVKHVRFRRGRYKF